MTLSVERSGYAALPAEDDPFENSGSRQNRILFMSEMDRWSRWPKDPTFNPARGMSDQGRAANRNILLVAA
jgi:hypothetical protein